MKIRQEALQSIANAKVDLCVIGGGASGAGCALDAQLRGLRTVLVDAGDFAGATSSAATKIIHGGVRYLQDAVTHLDIHQYDVVKKALRERILMLHNGPFLTRTLEFVVPCFSLFDVLYYGIGLKIYDWMAGKARLFPSRYISHAEAIKRFPSLKSKGLKGAVVYADGQFDDARYDITLIRTFTEAGGEALNYAKVIGFETGPNGKLVAAQVRDQISGQSFTLRARAFVNATGPFRQRAQPRALRCSTPNAPEQGRSYLSSSGGLLRSRSTADTQDRRWARHFRRAVAGTLTGRHHG